jgi:acyl-CoA reductase-like NAD-dependent aldehyde dehydrogenase
MSESAAPTNGTSDGASYVVPFLLNGEDYRPASTFDVVSPATGKVVHQCGSASTSDADAAVDAASAAFKAWRKTTPGYRRDIFLKAAETMDRRRKELAQYMVDETGCAPFWAEFNLTVSIDIIKDVAGRIATLGGIIPATADENTSALVVKEPYGVILAIAPWYVESFLYNRFFLF